MQFFGDSVSRYESDTKIIREHFPHCIHVGIFCSFIALNESVQRYHHWLKSHLPNDYTLYYINLVPSDIARRYLMEVYFRTIDNAIKFQLIK